MQAVVFPGANWLPHSLLSVWWVRAAQQSHLRNLSVIPLMRPMVTVFFLVFWIWCKVFLSQSLSPTLAGHILMHTWVHAVQVVQYAIVQHMMQVAGQIYVLMSVNALVGYCKWHLVPMTARTNPNCRGWRDRHKLHQHKLQINSHCLQWMQVAWSVNQTQWSTTNNPLTNSCPCCSCVLYMTLFNLHTLVVFTFSHQLL